MTTMASGALCGGALDLCSSEGKKLLLAPPHTAQPPHTADPSSLLGVRLALAAAAVVVDDDDALCKRRRHCLPAFKHQPASSTNFEL